MGSLIISAEYSDTMSHMATHYHDCHQLIYLAKGQATFTVSGHRYPVFGGTLILISRFEEHSIQVESDCYQRFTLRISPEISNHDSTSADPLFGLLVNRPKNFQHTTRIGSDSNIQQLLYRIVEEKKNTDSLSDKMLDALLMQLLIIVYRADPERIYHTGEDIHLVRQIQKQFETDYAGAFTLESLSQQYHISPSYLSHMFKRVTGTSVMGYLASCRFAAAKRYLVESELEVGRIVELCGFSDNSNFSRSFKTTTGITPSDFRNQFRRTK